MARSRKNHKYIGQQPLFKPDSDWVAPNLGDLPAWKGVKRIGLDTEARDPTLTKLGPGVRRGGYTVGISFAIEDGPSHYLPMRHHGGGNLDPNHVIAYMKDQAKEYTGAICGANLQYDLDFLAEIGIVFHKATFLDIQVAEPLIDENQFSYSLDVLAGKYGFMGKEETLLDAAATAYGLDRKKDMWQLPAKFVGPYAIVDAELPLKILRKQERVIDDQGLWDIYRLESRVLPVLVKMRRRGIRIDFDQLDKVEVLTIKKEQEFLDIIYHETGVRIKVDEINKGRLVVAALDVAQIPYGRTDPTEKFPDGQASVKKEFLEPNKDLPLVNAILEARSYNKVRNTFAKSIRNHQVNGRIHCTFNQLRTQQDNSDDVKGVGPGRLSSCDPNLQQQPSKHVVLGKMWRSIYLPDEGGRWAALDYCFSADTEVLTEHGFVPFPKLSRNVKVAQYWPDGSVTYAMPKAYQVVPYSGEMYHIHGQRQIDLLVSPNHRCALISPEGKLSFQRADEVWSGGKIIPQNGIIHGTLSLPKTTVQQAAVIQADGSYRTSHYRVFVGKDRKIGRLRDILGRNEDYVCKTKAASHAFKLELNPLIVPGKQKLFNREKLLTLEWGLRKIFLEELLHWDGSKPSCLYTTTVKENAEIVQEIACLTGFRSNYDCRPQPNGRKDLHTVTLNLRAGTYVKTLEKTTESYDGTIYCVTMPASTVIVRRNGRVAVCGQSQQEPRLFVHYAHIAGCAGTQDAVDGFAKGFDWHDMTTEMAFGIRKADDKKLFAKMRKKAKAVFLGLTYGMGQAKMCKSCGFTTEVINIRGAEREVAGPEGRAFLAEFNKKVPFLGEIKDMAEKVAWNRKFIRTILDRHIHYPPGCGMERKALNNLIQGSAADQTKLAMVLLDENNFRIQLQIHDEIDTTVYSENTAKEMAEIMTTCVPLVVPSKVDIEIGANWGDSME